ncbi:hypothetical protein DL767_002326 [Monosporascus sp. MG133]|nr:hypothetical protein DL767_002326 [Monosporascus sp. MG133]
MYSHAMVEMIYTDDPLATESRVMRREVRELAYRICISRRESIFCTSVAPPLIDKARSVGEDADGSAHLRTDLVSSLKYEVVDPGALKAQGANRYVQRYNALRERLTLTHGFKASEDFQLPSHWQIGDTLYLASPNSKQLLHVGAGVALPPTIRKWLEKIEIRFGATAAAVDVETSAVVLSDGERIEGFDLIITAGGVKSKMKPRICPPDDSRAQPTGEAAYRFTLDRSVLESDEELLALVQRPWAAEVPNFRMLVHPPSPVWFKGSTILLGNACHAMLPYLGQDVAQAVGDAAAIATILSTIRSREQLPLALRVYEASRKERVEQIQAATRVARVHPHLKDREAQAVRDLQRKAASEANQNTDVVKMQPSHWVWNAVEVAQSALTKWAAG